MPTAGPSLKRPREDGDQEPRPCPTPTSLPPHLQSPAVPPPHLFYPDQLYAFSSVVPTSTDFGIDLQASPSAIFASTTSADALYSPWPMTSDPFSQGLSPFGAGLDFQYGFSLDPALPVDWGESRRSWERKGR